MHPIDYKVGQVVTIDSECMERMRSSNRSCVTPGYPSDAFLKHIEQYVGKNATVTYRFKPSYEMTIRFADGCSFHMKDTWVKAARTLHFTLTGQYAGVVVCGDKRDLSLHDYMHSPSGSSLKKHIELKGGAEHICPHCLWEFIRTYDLTNTEDNDVNESPRPDQIEWDGDTPEFVKALAQPTYDRIVAAEQGQA